MSNQRSRRAAVALVVVLLVAVATACSSGGGSAAPAAPGTSAGAAPTATIPAPDGLPAFYGVPDPLPDGNHGDLIASERITLDGVDGAVWRVMYRSESLAGDPIAVTGLVVVPSTPAPDGGRPVITYAHGTVGIADACAPSVDATRFAPLANPLLAQGYVVVATDFEGLGTPGRHPYLVGESEGRGVLDIVEAARQMPEADASSRVAIWGHSQGGHAALFAGHIAPQWTPDLDVVGVVAGAPPSQLLLVNAALQKSPFAYYVGMVAAGFNAAYGDAEAPLADVLTDAGVQWIDRVDTTCAPGLAVASRAIDFSTLEKADPASVPAWNALLQENDPQSFTTPIAAPLLIIHGGSDEQIPVLSSAALFARLCAIGQVEQRWVYPDQSHAGVVLPSLTDMLTWIGHRFEGTPAPDPMAPQGPPVPTTQSCPAT